MADLYPGEYTTFYLSFVDGNSSPIYSGVSGTNINMYHFYNSMFITDISGATMTNQVAPFQNIWYYNYTVPSGADLTTYNIVYSALYSGVTLSKSETINMIPSTVYTPYFSGSVAISGIVTDPSGNAINNATVVFASGNQIISTTTTNVSGVYYDYLNPQNYLGNFSAQGYFNNQVQFTVPSGFSTWNLGLTTLVPNNQGSLVISDSYVQNSPYANNQPLPNLKVTLYSIDEVAGGIPLATTYTNSSGTFFLNSDIGHFILSVNGMDTNYQKYHIVRNIEVSPVYNYPAYPSGSPINFSYGSTSMYNFL